MNIMLDDHGPRQISFYSLLCLIELKFLEIMILDM